MPESPVLGGGLVAANIFIKIKLIIVLLNTV